jgi:UDP-N-acetylmuramate dehydrogenase
MTLAFQENVPLAPMTTLGIGGPARFFIEAADEAAILEADSFGRDRQLPLFVLGGGSNIVVADAGFPGIVLHVAIPGCEFLPSQPYQSRERLVRAGAGMNWDSFVEFCVQQDLAGVECLSGIPGSVGGTPVQNVGAYGQEVSNTIRWVHVFDRLDQRVRDLDNAACGFAYRRSLFNSTARDRYIVLSVTFALQSGGTPTLDYRDLQQRFQGASTQPTLSEVREVVRATRHRKAMLLVPEDPDCRSVGSFFRNPVISETLYREIARQYPNQEIPHYPVAKKEADSGIAVKLAAAWLIEQSGFFKGYPFPSARKSAVGISSKHTLALVNRGGARAADLLDLMKEIQTNVQERFHICLEPEPVFVGFPSCR